MKNKMTDKQKKIEKVKVNSKELKELKRGIKKLREETDKELYQYAIIHPQNLAENIRIVWRYFNSYNNLLFKYLEERDEKNGKYK